jgi:diguanylate cyclase (GGDEF)-like protein
MLRRTMIQGGATDAWRIKVTATGVALAAALGWADYLGGGDVSLLAFYVALVAAVAWRAGRTAGIIVAAASALAWSTAHWPRPEPTPTFLWNGFNRVAVFVGVAVLADLLGFQTLLAHTDSLTGLKNRRALLQALHGAAQARRARAFCIMSIDLDNFKHVNDAFGHAAGDTLLRQFSDVLREATRPEDIAARIGGDEFAILFWRMTRARAEAVADRLIERFARVAGGYGDDKIGVSIGIGVYQSLPDRLEQVLERADRALYDAKASGKNRIVFAE